MAQHAQLHPRHRTAGLLLRPALTLAARQQREHQRTAPPVLPQRPAPTSAPTPKTTSTRSPANSTDDPPNPRLAQSSRTTQPAPRCNNPLTPPAPPAACSLLSTSAGHPASVELVAPAPLAGTATPHFWAAALSSPRTCWRCSLVSGPHGRVTAASSRHWRCSSVSPFQKARALANGSVTSHFFAAASTLARRAARSASSSGPTGRLIAAPWRQVRCSSVSFFHRPAGGGARGCPVGGRVGSGAHRGDVDAELLDGRDRSGGGRGARRGRMAPAAARAVPAPTAIRVVRRRVMGCSLARGDVRRAPVREVT